MSIKNNKKPNLGRWELKIEMSFLGSYWGKGISKFII